MGGCGCRSGSSREYQGSDEMRRENRAFYTLLLVTTLTCTVLVLSACSLLAYYRLRYGPLTLGGGLSPGCPSNQEWSECGYACNLTCAHQFTVCATVCREGCECPDRAPLWHHDRCVARDQCPTATDNGTMNLNGHFNKNDPTVVASDTLHHGDSDTDKLSGFVQRLWRDGSSQFNSSSLQYNLQGETQATLAVDRAEHRLFPDISYAALEVSDIYRTFIDLLNEFKVHVKEEEVMTGEKQRAISVFVDAVLRGSVMKETESFLKEEGLISEQSFRELLYKIWFEPYPRSPRYNTTDSCGFEHVFVGEVKGRKILGLHSWIQFSLLENFKELNYYGHISDVYSSTDQKLLGLSVQYVWGQQRKRQGSFLVGTSPDFDLAVYTVCFLLHPDRICRFELEGAELSVQTHDVKHVVGWQVSTAFPVL